MSGTSERSPENQLGSMDVNTSTVYYNPELFNALQVTRAGGNDPLFDQMFAGLRLSGVPTTVPVVDGITSRGSDQLRQSTATQANLANGNYVAVANALITPLTLSIAAGASGIQGMSSRAGVCDSAQRLRSPCQWPDEHTDALLPGELPDRQSSTERRDLRRQSRPQ